ncbi:Kinase-related protein of unknown function (DUF1296 [Striga hermonthica]|uniref:GBF-interacting protein 1 N-terminal domain-containing protein n=1 Tax=Striga hermonthica TaxID=68872 RepID=A0A9N7R737_STRHE|nr:Kinase-related protein of unknown function (DUF1296 [Striga hermonthica]
MVSGSRVDGGAQVLSAGVRRTILSIKEIVGNHSDADIYVALKESNMDPNETAQKLLNQDPFHEVKRRRDRKKESVPYKSFATPEPQKSTEPDRMLEKKSTYSDRVPVKNSTYSDRVPVKNSTYSDRMPVKNSTYSDRMPMKNSTYSDRMPVKNSTYSDRMPVKNNTYSDRMPVKNSTYSDRNARRSGYSRDTATGAIREFRVVRDNRVNQNSSADSKPAQSKVAISSGSTMSSSTETSGHQEPTVGQHSSRALNSSALTQPKQAKVTASGVNGGNEILGEKHLLAPSATSRVTKANGSQPYSAGSSSSSAVGVYSSNSDPVHVPSPHSKPATNIGAIRREVGVVGTRRQSSENSAKPSVSQSTPLSNTHSARDGQQLESAKPFNAISQSEHANHKIAPESAVPVSKSFSSNHQYGSRPHQPMGHQKASQPNKEWKPKTSAKPGTGGPGVIGSPVKTVSPPSDKPDILRKEAAQIEDSVSRLNISENKNVIIAAHIRVSETDKCRLTFGSLGTDLGTSASSMSAIDVSTEALSINHSASAPVSAPESSGDEQAGGSKPLEVIDDSVRSSGSFSPALGGVSDHQLMEKKESSEPQDMDNFADADLVRDSSPSYSPEALQQQDTPELPTFSGYDPQMGYDMSYFRPVVDETVRGTGLPSSQEVLSTHTTSTIAASSIAMVQQPQQQQQLAQMYPQLHFTNIMPYRQFLSPVYVPPMPVPGYSNSPAYPHPSNGNSYVLMPGNSSHHLSASGVKYGVQQFKPVPAGGPTGFGNFTSPAGYDESSRIKYKDNLYVPNPQAETSEIWMNPRELPGLQSASYYNMPGQTPHPAYLTSHTAHASFTAAQSSHMQFPGMYHHPPSQPGAIAGQHHIGPTIGGSVGVGVAAPGPGAQVGAYQQPQLGHLNWTGNF